MAIKLTIDGVTLVTDTPTEAMHVLHAFRRSRVTYAQLHTVLDAEGQQFLVVLANHPKGIITADLIAVLGIEPLRLPHVIRRIAKPARKLGLDMADVYTSRKTSKGGKPYMVYTINAKLLASKGK